MRQAVLAGFLLLLAATLLAATVDLSIQSPEGDPLPGARVSLIGLSEAAEECEVVQQVIANEQGRASLTTDRPGVYMVAVELAGFIGAELGPFRVEGENATKSEAPGALTVLLHTACFVCVDDSVANSYLLAKRCGASDPAQVSVQ
jgi:hypothetical protein